MYIWLAIQYWVQHIAWHNALLNKNKIIFWSMMKFLKHKEPSQTRKSVFCFSWKAVLKCNYGNQMCRLALVSHIISAEWLTESQNQCHSPLLDRSNLVGIGTVNTWAMSWENLLVPYVNNNVPYVNNKGADQPAHPHSLISVFVVCCLDSLIPKLAKYKNSRLYLVSTAESFGLGLTWSHNPKGTFPNDVAH